MTQFQSATPNDNCTPSDDASENDTGDFDMTAEANVAAEATAEPTNLPSVSDSVYVYWPLDREFYTGTVSGLDGGKHEITYDDGEMESLNLEIETWRFRETPVLYYSKIQLNPGLYLQSIEREAIREHYETFGGKDFIVFQVQGPLSYVTENAYVKEEDVFTFRTCDCVNTEGPGEA